VFGSFCAAGILRRVELSPQPFVSLISFARHANQGDPCPPKTLAVVIPICLLQVVFMLFFVSRYFVVSRRLSATQSYNMARLKFMSIYVLYRHTIIPLVLTVIATTLSAALFPTTLLQVRQSTNTNFAHLYTLDVPYYARSGIVLVYCTWACIESYIHLPAVYKPTWLERALIHQFGMQAGSALAPRQETDFKPRQGDDQSDIMARRVGNIVDGVPPQSTVVNVHAMLQPNTFTGQDSSVQENALTSSREEDAEMDRETQLSNPVVWEARRNVYGQVVIDKTFTAQFRFDECVLAFNFSWMTYLSDDVITRALNDDTQRKFSARHIWHVPAYDLVALTAVSREMLVVSFRGSVSVTNMRLNLRTSQARQSPLSDPSWLHGKWKPPAWGSKRPLIHRGFENAYATLRSDILSDVKAALADNRNFRVFLCGHSLGGALATLCAFDCRVMLHIPEGRVSLFTFGSPRVGNPSFSRRFAAVGIDSWRICNHSDIIANNPVRLLHDYMVG
jgi:hypothetical protein